MRGTAGTEATRGDAVGIFRDLLIRHFLEDYLALFELIGALKLTDKIVEVWTNVPHVQGVSGPRSSPIPRVFQCAKFCRDSTILCESFSYEARDRLCLLSDSNSLSLVTPRRSSLYYKRRYSPSETLL